tara:strand:- start:660 stop:1079 length:420 start_codon:yes stop_codon:yes gene_type:complete
MKNISDTLSFKINGKGMYEITDETKNWVKKNKLLNGHLNLFILHTSASLTIMENASSEILDDINSFFLKLVPENSSLYKHSYEGDDDMPAHIKNMLTQTSLTVPINKGKIILGIWQGIYLFEHRYNSIKRKIMYSYIGS